MNTQNTNKILKVVLSVGDESGIGPEIILKALYSNKMPKNIEFKLVGSKKIYKIHMNILDP
jgi:4-hydroxythreonine-4-phosphate dehydrogenase